MGRAPCCDKQGLKKGPWTPDEDQKLVAYIQRHGHGSWRALPKHAGLLRCGKSCRLRWTNYLRPDIKRGRFSLDEEQLIIHLHAILGNRWSAIAAHLAGRTDNEIKNYWNTHLKKRLLHMGIDPVTHKATQSPPLLCSKLSHLAQWDSARLEAEARLARRTSPDSFLRSWKAQASGPLRSDLPSVQLPSFVQHWEPSMQSQLTSNEFSRSSTATSSPTASSLDFDSAGAALLLNHLSSMSGANTTQINHMETLMSPTSTLRPFDGCSVLSEDESSSSYGSLLPPEMLLDLVDSAMASNKSEPSVGSWPDVGQMASKDYWSNMLKLVGPPCQEMPVAVMER
ncbi:transcription factor MYB, plant [Marchantia polymorpha subsp. ruderalis]|uniref:Uncharacterized protein n=2 Tax=Marchantia polymorpha TaxID=3197 RepID=A0AAF6AN95_MARPO|nr:hypothetical protein MARPO_0096s0058 [Marchantia polymorpha]BBM97915.1 hypothetical protein Mp_1g09420 [Marchantia polymorpha subsp. ruderalis]|eukprot:PTQ32713.1 hypothetical protein MARPO_0096s0058 [Marchantia polymorpha]